MVAPDAGDAAEATSFLDVEEDEEEEDEWTGDPKNRPIWKFPVVSRVREIPVVVFAKASARQWKCDARGGVYAHIRLSLRMVMFFIYAFFICKEYRCGTQFLVSCDGARPIPCKGT